MIQSPVRIRVYLKTFFILFFAFLSSRLLSAQSLQELSFHEISNDSVFDVVTWNIEWFGHSEYGPEDLDLQMNNVIEVIRTIDADLYAFQEIANPVRFKALDDSLEFYQGFTAGYLQSQQTAYLFRSSVIDSVDSGYLAAQQNEYNWAGRLPLFFEFDVTVAGKVLRVFTYNIHAKAFADQQSYDRRAAASNSLKLYLDRSRQNASVIILGDFNDQLIASTFAEKPSPYEVFIEDDFYLAVTKPLEEEGRATYLPEEFRSFIDHIIVTNVLKKIHIAGAQKVVNIDYIENFESTTSDHAPVWARFDFAKDFDDRYEELPDEFVVGSNYPNPFNPSTTISFALSKPTEVTVAIYDITGRKISLLSESRPFDAGKHTLTFNAAGLTSGIYFYRVELRTGESKARKMTFIK